VASESAEDALLEKLKRDKLLSREIARSSDDIAPGSLFSAEGRSVTATEEVES
jgi:hypothetical protein